MTVINFLMFIIKSLLEKFEEYKGGAEVWAAVVETFWRCARAHSISLGLYFRCIC